MGSRKMIAFLKSIGATGEPIKRLVYPSSIDLPESIKEVNRILFI